jgi:hypothetical protein
MADARSINAGRKVRRGFRLHALENTQHYRQIPVVRVFRFGQLFVREIGIQIADGWGGFLFHPPNLDFRREYERRVNLPNLASRAALVITSSLPELLGHGIVSSDGQTKTNRALSAGLEARLHSRWGRPPPHQPMLPHLISTSEFGFNAFLQSQLQTGPRFHGQRPNSATAVRQHRRAPPQRRTHHLK